MSRKYRILFISDSPWIPTGYGKVSKYLLHYMKHDFDTIFLSVTDPTLGSITIDGVDVYRYVRNEHDLLWFYTHFNCDVVLLLKEPWVISNLDKVPIHYILYAPFTQVEVPRDYLYYASLACSVWLPSKYETEQVRSHGIDAYWIPHGVNYLIFKPMDNVEELRKKYGLDKFDVVIGLFGMNTLRKVLPNQLEGIKVFIDNNPDLKVGIYLHTTLVPIKEYWNGYDLRKIIEKFELEDNVVVPNQHALLVGFSESSLAELYNCCNVVVDACYEGFGLHILEAQACGVPTVTLSVGGGAEINFLNLKVTKFSKFYTQLGSYFLIPDPYDIASKIEEALKYGREGVRDYLHEKAREYSWSNVYYNYLRPTLVQVLENLYYRKRNVGKKIALVTSWSYRCGIAKYVSKLLSEFNKHEVYVIPIPTFRNCSYDEFVKYIVKRIREIEPDVVWVQLEHGVFGKEGTDFEVKFYRELKNELPKTKIVTEFHVVDVYKGVEAFISTTSDKIVVHNIAMHERLSKLFEDYWITGKEVHVIPLCSVEFPLSREEARRKLGVSTDVKIVGLIGFIHPRKGIDVFFTIVETLKNEIPNLVGVILGGFHAEVETQFIKYVKKRARELGVTITGFVNDDVYYTWLKAMDVVVYPVFMISSSGIVIDCIVNHVPIIVLDCPAFKELPVLKAHSIDEFIELTRELLTNSKKYENYVNYLKQVSEQYKCRNVVKDFEVVLDDDEVTTFEVIECFKKWLAEKKASIIGNSVKLDFKEIAEYCSSQLGKKVTIQKVAYVIRKVLKIENDWIKIR